MSQEAVTKKYSTFIRGLVTEASAINFPDDASVDEDNMHLHRDGSRERRWGIDYETGYSKTTSTLSTYPEGATSFYSWENACDAPGKNFLVVQTGKFIEIFEHTSAGYGAYHTQYEIGVDTPFTPYGVTAIKLAGEPFSFVTVRGALFCAQKGAKPFYIQYVSATDSFTVIEYSIKVRDIWGVPLGIASSDVDHPVNLNGDNGWLHRYNLANQGWPNETVLMATTTGEPPISGGAAAQSLNPIDETLSALGYAPSLSDSYWLSHGLLDGTFAPQNVEVYRPDKLTTNPLLYLRMPRGKFIIDAFTKDRADQLGLGLSGDEDRDSGSPSLLGHFAGRIWYSGIESGTAGNPVFDDKVNYNSTLFFSQIVESFEHAGHCYQENDPTSKDFSTILDTDGGTIELTGAGRIQGLVPLHSFLVVLADNGIWVVAGGQNGFTPSSYSVRQISNVGCVSPNSIVQADDFVLYWSTSGIYALNVDPQSQDVRTNNITEDTIQTLYNEIPEEAKRFSQGSYNSQERRISWFYSNDSTFDGVTNTWIKTKELYFDLVIKSWSVNTIYPLASGTPYVIGSVNPPRLHRNTTSGNVLADGDEVETGGDQVVVDETTRSSLDDDVIYICGDGTEYTFGTYKNTDFLDWETEDSVGIDAEAYLITGYENLDETARKKQAVYMTAHFERTEDNFIDDGASGAILDNQSGCMLQARWDWADHSNSGKWGSEQQIYRLKRLYSPTGTLPESFDNGYPVTTTKNKLRGSGLSSHLKFSSEAGKDMHLLGWQIDYKGNKKV